MTIRTPARARHRVLLAVLVSVACTAVGLGAATTAGAQGSIQRGTTHYALAERMCSTPAAGQLGCMAIRLVDVAKGTPGAKAYVEPASGTGRHGGYSPADLATAYGYNPASVAGSTQTVAVVDAYDDPSALSDLNAFDAAYHLPRESTTSFRKVNQRGTATPLPKADHGWAGEIALDVEAVRAVCNRCKILLVEATSPSIPDVAAAENTAAALHATEISNSYGGPEDAPGNTVTTAKAYNHPGIVITAASGDHGWDSWDLINDSAGTSYNASDTPAGYPSVVAVGATSLQVNAGGSRNTEQVWNGNGPADQTGFQYGKDLGASGGGCSTLYPAPAWQAAVTGYANTGCGSKRLVSDVAAVGDPYTGFDVWTTYGGSGWETIGGTSLSTPLVAAMWALAGGSGGVAYPAQSLYDHSRYAPSSLYDVTVGGTGFCGGDTAAACSAAVDGLTGNATGNPNNLADASTGDWLGLLDCQYATDGSENTLSAATQCNATAGYDGPSGVGTPRGITGFTPMRPSIALTAPTLIKVARAAAFSATRFSDNIPGSSAATYHWSWGDGHTSVLAGTRATHTYARRGTYSVTLWVVDNHGRSSRGVAKRYTIGYAPAAAISGAGTVHARSTHTWAAAVTEKNTGGRITKWAWTIGGRLYGSGTRLAHHFTSVGSYRLTLTVTDDSGLRTSTTRTVRVIR